MGNKYLKLMERWGFINDLSLDDAIKEIKPSVLEDLLKEWSVLQETSLKTDGICNVSPEIPMVPVSSTVDLNPDLIANIALYSDKQIIPDPIDIALDKTEDPLENTAGFLFYLKKGMEDIEPIKPLLQENLVELILECTPDSRQVVKQQYLKPPPFQTDQVICIPGPNGVSSCYRPSR